MGFYTQRYQQRPIYKDLVVEKVVEVSSVNRRYSLTLERGGRLLRGSRVQPGEDQGLRGP
jgi:hypothetical protein